jgi:hypothetical protein
MQEYMGDEEGVDQVKGEDNGIVALGRAQIRIYTRDVRWRRPSQEGRGRRQA